MKEKVGRKDPTDPNLETAQLILQVGLRKEWTDKCSYWIELYAKPVGKKKKTNVFYVYRQWSFYKEEDGVIDGNICSTPVSGLAAAFDSLIDVLTYRVDSKGYIVSYAKEHDAWTGLVDRVEIETGKRKLALVHKVKDRELTLAEKFRQSQIERQEKAEW